MIHQIHDLRRFSIIIKKKQYMLLFSFAMTTVIYIFKFFITFKQVCLSSHTQDKCLEVHLCPPLKCLISFRHAAGACRGEQVLSVLCFNSVVDFEDWLWYIFDVKMLSCLYILPCNNLNSETHIIVLRTVCVSECVCGLVSLDKKHFEKDLIISFCWFL